MQTNYYQDFSALSDGQVRTEDGYTFNIHKVVLSKKSDYFSRLFCGALGISRNDYLIPGIEGEIFGDILSYIYSGKVEISGRNIHDILLAADYILCDDLIKHIQDIYMKESLSVSNCLPILLAALKIQQNKILRTSYRYIQANFENVIAIDDSEVGKLPLEVLEMFLEDKHLHVKNEYTIWMAISKWVQADRYNRLCRVPNLLMFLTVPAVDEPLARIILEHNIVACNPFCEEINITRKTKSSNLNSFFAWLFGYLNIEIFREFLEKYQKPELASSNCRIPKHLHFIIQRHSKAPMKGFNYPIYVTYDENIDLWRKIFEVNFYFLYMECIGDSIYMFDTYRPIRQFCLPEKKWITMSQFSAKRSFYCVIQLQGLIYVLGGISAGIVNTVEVYNPVLDIWFYVSPMMPVFPCKAVTLGNKIYAVGLFENSMVAQSYNSELNTWTVLSSPSRLIFDLDTDFQIFAYRGRLFLMGTPHYNELLLIIQVFDPASEEWTAHPDLPYNYFHPKAIVSNNELIIYECDINDILEPNPAVTWDEELQCWKVSEQSLTLKSLPLYTFLTHKNRGCINSIIRENKNNSTQFVKSPFV